MLDGLNLDFSDVKHFFVVKNGGVAMMTDAEYEVYCAENGVCNHDKVYSREILTSYPPQQPWVCRKCGAKGSRILGQEAFEEYSELMLRFSDTDGLPSA